MAGKGRRWDGIEACISGGTHPERTMEMYQELGLEVYLEQVDPRECEGCTACYMESEETMYRVYTRPKREND